MSHASLIGKILMTTDPAERQWYEDQATVLGHSGPNLRGNSNTVVLVGPPPALREVSMSQADFAANVTPAFLADLVSVGGRVIDGGLLFTPRDNPRKYRA